MGAHEDEKRFQLATTADRQNPRSDRVYWVLPQVVKPHRSVDREVVRARVGSRALLLTLHQQIIEQTGRADAEQVR